MADGLTKENSDALQRLGVMYPGELLKLARDHVSFDEGAAKFTLGTLYVTSYQLVFLVADKTSSTGASVISLSSHVASEYNPKYMYGPAGEKHFVLPLGHIADLRKVGGPLSADKERLIEIHSKLVRVVRFRFVSGTKARRDVFNTISQLAFQGDAFAYSFTPSTDGENGWHVYDARREFQRMGVHRTESKWRESPFNVEHRVVPSYPATLFVPATITDENLAQVAKYRSNGRIPVLCWLHPTRHGSEDFHAALCRCSQPGSGIQGKKSSFDEQLLEHIRRCNSPSLSLFILDARPKINATGNAFRGGGYEDVESGYANCRLKFLQIDNIHAIRDAYNRIRDAVLGGGTQYVATNSSAATSLISGIATTLGTSAGTASSISNSLVSSASSSSSSSSSSSGSSTTTSSVSRLNGAAADGSGPENGDALDDSSFFAALHESKWLGYLKAILEGALLIVDAMENLRSSVVLHCSDGWDRTAQLSSLAQIMMDPYYRTIRGFCVLVEKDWLDFGHKFSRRCGHRQRDRSTEESPIFIQFLDCVYQLMVQYPHAFEYNVTMLVYVIDQTYACCFGTFLVDAPVERATVMKNTSSLWSYILQNSEHFRSAEWQADEGRRQVLYPLTSIRSLVIFKEFFRRYDLW